MVSRDAKGESLVKPSAGEEKFFPVHFGRFRRFKSVFLFLHKKSVVSVLQHTVDFGKSINTLLHDRQVPCSSRSSGNAVF